ncbi:mucin-3A isoform X2 [Sardina pilchardus]|uniref:mucin-3A isoform X2 n=1 Tax=Sardina pilchardus TaxID=27697 RepID=UPI002E143C24
MSTGEFIREISVSGKGKANSPATFLPQKDFRKKGFQRKRLWDIRDVEQRLKGIHQHDLNHKNKPGSKSLAPLPQSIERPADTELDRSGTVQTKEDNPAFRPDKTQPSPPTCSSVLGFGHTLAEQAQAAPGGTFREETPTTAKDTFSNTEVNKEETPQKSFGTERAFCTAKEEVTTLHLENEKATSCQSQSAFGPHTSPLDLREDKHTVILKRQGETGYPYAQYTKKVIQIRVTEFTVPGTVKKVGNLNPDELKSDSSAESNSVCQPILCKFLDQTEDIIFPRSQSFDSAATHLQPDQTRSSPDMLTSSVVTALAPNWSARSRRQRPGAADVNLNTTEQEMQRRRQEVHAPSSLFGRDVPQQPFFGDPNPRIGDVFPEASNKENALSMAGSYSTGTPSNLFNLRNNRPVKRRISRAFSAGMGGGKTDAKTEVGHPLTSPVDTVLRPVSPHSLDLHWSRSVCQPGQFSSINSPPATTRQPGQFSSINSPPATTGSLLLSFRKTNMSSKSTGSPSETHPMTSNSSLNQNKNVSRMSEPMSYVTLQRNRAKSLLSPAPPLSSPINKPKGTSEFFPLSTSSEEKQYESLRPHLFLYPDYNIEIPSSPNTTSISGRGQATSSPQYNKLDGLKNTPLSPTPGSMLRRQHTLQGDSLLQSTPSHTSNLRRTNTLSNVSDLLNNNRVGTMLTNDSVGRTAPRYSSSIYSGIPRASLASSNLNSLTSYTDASSQNVTNIDRYTRSNNDGIHQARTVDIPTMCRRSRMASAAESPQIDSPVSPREKYSLCLSTNLTSPLPLRNSTNTATVVQQSLLNAPRSLSIRETNITDTSHHISTADKNRSPVERVAVSPSWQKNVEDLAPAEKLSQLSQSPSESPDPLSPAGSKRNICAPTTFSSLRLSSPASPTSPMPPSSLFQSERRETPPFLPSQETIQLKQFESSPAHAPTTSSSVKFSSPASDTSPPPPFASLPQLQRRESPVPPSLQGKILPLKQFESSPVHPPTTFSSFRLSSPALDTSPTPPSSLLQAQRREALVSSPPQDKNIQLRKGSESSLTHTPSPVSKFSFDLGTHESQRSSSKTDSTGTSVPGSSISEKNDRSPMSLSPYVSLLSARQTSSSASSPSNPRSLRSASFDGTANTSEMVSTLQPPYLSVKLSQEQLNTVGKQPSQVTPPLKKSMSVDTQGLVQPHTNQPVSTTSKYISDSKDTKSTSPRITLSPSESTASVSVFETQTRKQHDKMPVFRSDNVGHVSPTQTEKKGYQRNQSDSSSQNVDKHKSKDVSDSQSQKWSLFSSKNQKDSGSSGTEIKPPTQFFEKNKKNSFGNRMDQMLDRLKSFTVKYLDGEASLKTEDTPLHPNASSSRSRIPGSRGTLESCEQAADRDLPSASATSPVLLIQDQIATKPPKAPKRKESEMSFLKVPQSIEHSKTKPEQKLKNRHANQYSTLPANWRTSKMSSNPSSPMDFYSEDVKTDRNFSSTSQPRRKTTSLCEPQDDLSISNAWDEEGLLPSIELYSDIKYGLNHKRSISVSSVQSSRPSGTGRISRSSSRASSVSDLTTAADLMTLDDFMTPEATLTPPHSGKTIAPQIPKNESPNRVWSPASLERTSFPWENESDPTPPPSPTFSPTTRRLSRAPSASSQGSRSSHENVSPRGNLPSKNYTCNLSVFEESDSDSTTTDDEYYLDNDNGEETEL